MYTKCATCRKWDEHAYCGACHTCRPDVRDACVAVRMVQEAQALQAGHSTRKRQSSTYTQDPGIGANGCEPRVTPRDRNWYGSADYRQAARDGRIARKAAEREI
jgi:hypothetical protein